VIVDGEKESGLLNDSGSGSSNLSDTSERESCVTLTCRWRPVER
jgi:hypothetical protein